MKRSKKLFFVFATVFFIILGIVGYDISRRTTFPGSGPLLEEPVSSPDTTGIDSLKEKTDK